MTSHTREKSATGETELRIQEGNAKTLHTATTRISTPRIVFNERTTRRSSDPHVRVRLPSDLTIELPDVLVLDGGTCRQVNSD